MKMEFSSKDMLIWRMTAAVGWSVLFQFLLLSVFMLVVNINLWNPFAVDRILDCFLSSKLLYIFPLAGIIFMQGVLCSRDYLKQSTNQNNSTRFSRFISALSVKNLVALATHMVLGFVMYSTYSSLLSDSVNSIIFTCTSDTNVFSYYNKCLNEKKFFLVVAGLWVGFYTFINEHVLCTRHITFPPIQQHKYLRIRASIFPSIRKAASKSVFPCMLFIVIYYFKGGYLKSQFSTFASVNLEDEVLDTVFILFEKELLFYLWVLSTMFFLTLDVMETMFNINVTERAFFPITTFLLSSNNYTILHEAICCEKTPIIQHLGFLDLFLLSQNDASRRAELFKLSQPGGHPHSWNAVVTQCIKLVSDYTSKLKNIVEPAEHPASPKTTEKEKKPFSFTPDLHSSTQHSYRMRRLGSPVCETKISNPETFQQSYDKLIAGISKWFNSKVSAFYKKPLIAYFFGDMNEPRIKQLLFQSQPVVWAVETLSFLTCKSLREDSFGVAQKDLALIITTLVNLKQCMEKLQKQSVFIRNSKLNLLEVQMKNYLKFSVKQSIYRITVTFNTHMKDIALPTDIQQQIANFIAFKEI